MITKLTYNVMQGFCKIQKIPCLEHGSYVLNNSVLYDWKICFYDVSICKPEMNKEIKGAICVLSWRLGFR